MGLELKFLDCAWNGVSISTATADATGLELQPSSGCTNAISVPAQGDGESQRDGRKYVIKSAWISGMIDYVANPDEADIIPNSGCFFALVLDTQCNGATVNSEDVYTNPASVGLAMLPQPLRDLQQSKRFRILASKYVAPRDVTSGTDGTATVSLAPGAFPVVNLSWKGSIEVNCTGTTADVASVSDNALHVLAFSGVNTYQPNFRGKSRVRFMG